MWWHQSWFAQPDAIVPMSENRFLGRVIQKRSEKRIRLLSPGIEPTMAEVVMPDNWPGDANGSRSWHYLFANPCKVLGITIRGCIPTPILPHPAHLNYPNPDFWLAKRNSKRLRQKSKKNQAMIAGN